MQCKWKCYFLTHFGGREMTNRSERPKTNNHHHKLILEKRQVVVVVVTGQKLYPLGTTILIVLCQSGSVIRQSSRRDTRNIRRRWRMKREWIPLGQTAGSNLNFDRSKFRLWHHQNGRSNALIRSDNQYLDCISDMHSFKPLITRLKVPITGRFFPCL